MKHTAFGLITLMLIAGCGQEQPVTYEAPKEKTAPPAQQMGSDADNQAVMAAHAAMTAHAPPDAGFAAELPDGWEEKVGSGMRMVSYAIEGTAIDFYLISLSMGDVASNVNRWRGQVGLPAASADEIAAEVQVLQAGGRSVNYIEIYNEEGGKGIIAAIVDLAPKYWYFTAKGTVDELQAHAADIRKFLESVKIN